MTIVDFGAFLSYRLKSTMVPKELNIFIKPLHTIRTSSISIPSLQHKPSHWQTPGTVCGARVSGGPVPASPLPPSRRWFSPAEARTRDHSTSCVTSRVSSDPTLPGNSQHFPDPVNISNQGFFHSIFVLLYNIYIKDISSLEKNQDYIKIMSLGCKLCWKYWNISE